MNKRPSNALSRNQIEDILSVIPPELTNFVFAMTELTYFYQPDITGSKHLLTGDEFHHCIKVLRHQPGDLIGIFDGVGGQYQVELTEVTRQQCSFRILDEKQIPGKPFGNHIAIAPPKNMDRMEWFVEKACELGVDQISLILTANCERRKLRMDRLEKKAVSALKQSKSGYLTKINPLISFREFVKTSVSGLRFVAFLENGLPYLGKLVNPNTHILTMIGPEGDFTEEEISLAEFEGFRKVSLGKSTLRTETAGLMAAHFVNVANAH